jgi:hypothetical protein
MAQEERTGRNRFECFPRALLHFLEEKWSILKEWDGRPARLFCFNRYGRDARATLF